MLFCVHLLMSLVGTEACELARVHEGVAFVTRQLIGLDHHQNLDTMLLGEPLEHSYVHARNRQSTKTKMTQSRGS